MAVPLSSFEGRPQVSRTRRLLGLSKKGQARRQRRGENCGRPILGALPLVGVAFLVFALLPSSLNLLSVGADTAATRGVDVARTQRLAFLSAALATSAAVSLAGPIGFVGIVVPHLVRLMTGVDHRIVLPASALFGAAFLVACDLVARTVLAPVEVPVGVVTAMLGGPFFLWLLVRRG